MNIISAIAILGVIVSSAAIIIVLSAINGIEDFTIKGISTFDPEIKIKAVKGKSFTISDDSIKFDQIRELPQVAYFSETYADNAIIRFENKKTVTTVKGVDSSFEVMTNLDSLLIEGEYVLKRQNYQFALLGAMVANELSYRTNFVRPIHLYVPQRGLSKTLVGTPKLNTDYIFPSGIYNIPSEEYSRYVIVPIDFARALFDVGTRVTSIELKLIADADLNAIQKKIRKILGEDYKVKNFYEQNEFTYRTIHLEKLMIFLILSLILAIASLNIVSSISMLIIDKEGDIATLKSLGATLNTIKRIFLIEGWLISGLGAIVGISIGALLSWLQHNYGFITFPTGSNAAVAAYPMRLQLTDMIWVVIMVACIGFIMTWYPVRFISGRYLKK